MMFFENLQFFCHHYMNGYFTKSFIYYIIKFILICTLFDNAKYMKYN